MSNSFRLHGLFAPWTIACQAPLTMGFSRQEYWGGLPCPLPGHLPDPQSNPRLSCLLRWLACFLLPLAPPGKPTRMHCAPPTAPPSMSKSYPLVPVKVLIIIYGLIRKKVIHRGNEVLVRAGWIQGGT